MIDSQPLSGILEDIDIPQKCDLKAYEKIEYASLKAHVDTFGIVIYSPNAACGRRTP